MTLNTSLTRPKTRCHLNIPLSHFVSNTNKPKHHESCSTKSKPYSMLQIKNFRCCVVKAKFRNSFVCLKKYSVILKTLYCVVIFYPLNQSAVGLRTLYHSPYNGCPLYWRGRGVGLSSKFWPSRSSALRPRLRKVCRLSIMHCCQSCIYLSCARRPLWWYFRVGQRNLLTSRRCRSQAGLRCWKLVIWLPWIAIR